MFAAASKEISVSNTGTGPLAHLAADPGPADAPSRFPIEPVIQTMHTCLDQPLSLHALAKGAGWSAYHFHRLFRRATGIPPNEYLTALRLQEAKRLLLTTSLSVNAICFDVGYVSPGTFTARFTHLVGISPGRLRHFADTATLPSLGRLSELIATPGTATLPAGSISGEIRTPAAIPGPIFVGLFPKAIPQARPIGAAVLTAPGRYQITGLADGDYHLLAASLPWAEDPRIPSLAGPGVLVGAGAEPLLVRHGRCSNPTDIVLRTPRPPDPPVLSCLPFLLSQRLARTAISA
jgi:AraC family transcriptional regulator